MDLYYEVLKRPVFTINDICGFYNNIESARSAVKRLLGKGRIIHIRNNLYTAISGETGAPLANRFQIASSVTDTSYVTHHTAMEYYGITDQVFYDVYVGSETAFQSFVFDGYTYRYVHSRFPDGIEDIEYSGGVRVTDRERTVLDSIKDMDKIAGAEEVIDNLGAIKLVKEGRIIQYLALYNNQFLYQKTGYLLSRVQNKLGLSDMFFELCRDKAGKSTRYLSSDHKNGIYDSEWKLVVPEILFLSKNGELTDADI